MSRPIVSVGDTLNNLLELIANAEEYRVYGECLGSVIV